MGALDLRQSLTVSLGLHLLIALLLLGVGKFAPQFVPPPKTVWIEVDPILPSSAKKAKQDRSEKRIVQSDKLEKSQTADENAHLGEQNQRVDRETISMNHTLQAGGAKTRAQSRTAKSDTQSRLLPKTLALKDLGVALPSSHPTPAPPSAQFGEFGKTAQDYVPGLPESERTALNTKEYVFFSYFQRIRHRLDLAWEPILRDHLFRFYRQGRRLASEMDHITQLVVVLDSRGTVTEVQLFGTSGTETLDEAAVKAFNSAGPFPNPPRGIVEPDGRIRIRWDFVLKT